MIKDRGNAEMGKYLKSLYEGIWSSTCRSWETVRVRTKAGASRSGGTRTERGGTVSDEGYINGKDRGGRTVE